MEKNHKILNRRHLAWGYLLLILQTKEVRGKVVIPLNLKRNRAVVMQTRSRSLAALVMTKARLSKNKGQVFKEHGARF
jgi:hypothetical protein